MTFHRSWRPYELPVGPHPIPRWAKGLHVEWMDGYGNWPNLILKASENVGSWPDMRFVQDGHRYMATHADGRASTHYHSGRISITTMKRRVRTGRMEWRDEEYEAYATTQQEGYAGRHYPIVLGGVHPLRGKEVVLRGPWHGSPPPGYSPVSFVDMSSSHVRRDLQHAAKHPRASKPWFKHMAYFGLEIRHDVLAAIAARYLPHLQFALTQYETHEQLEPMKPEWDCPKIWWLDRQRSAAA